MLTCNLQGGLGNQLFQIFTTIAYSLKTNQSFFFINQHQLTNERDAKNGTTVRYTYWETFLSGLKPFIRSQDKLPKLDLWFKEQSFQYDASILLNLLNNQQKVKMLVGYFQSYKYFDSYKKAIFKLIKIEVKQLATYTIHSPGINFETTISMHFRLGDYKKLQDYHPVLPTDYYINALNLVLNQRPTNKPIRTVLYFCEDGDFEEVLEKITLLQSMFPYLIFERADNTLDDWEQMILMSLCNNNIIANSTFSWWGAYFNPNPTKTVCYPGNWFGPKAGHDICDMFPDDWTQI
uniref:Glycosyltransferase n=1 Tax=viral metagenome TaxID=1070528 RepID=A0A6C0I8D3_9ZZZZ